MTRLEDRLKTTLAAHLDQIEAAPMDPAAVFRRRSNRLVKASKIVIASSLVAGLFAGWSLFVSRGIVPNERPAPSAGGVQSEAGFHPPVEFSGELRVVPVTFPDGTTADIVFPEFLDPQSFIVRPSTSGGIGSVRGEAARELFVVYEGSEWFVEDLESPVATYEGADGSDVVLVQGAQEAPADLYLIFRFGQWTVALSDYRGEALGMSEEERRTWAMNLVGTQATNGFLRVEAIPPLVLSRPGDDAGPSMHFESKDLSVTLFLGECRAFRAGEDGFEEEEIRNIAGHSVHWQPGFASWCHPNSGVIVQVTSEARDEFMESVVEGLEIKSVRRSN